MTRTRTLLLGAAGVTTLALALACGGSSALNPPPTTTGSVAFLTTDATTEDWSSVGLIIRKASLVLASDTTASNPIVIYNGASDTTPVNLLQEDQVNDLLSQATGVPAGVYDRLIVEVDGNPANITLVPAADASGTVPPAIDPSLIVVKGASDPSNPTWKVLPTITLSTPVTVTAGQTSAVAVDFDLAHPAFIVEHDVTTPAGSQTLYCVNFGTRGIFRHKHAAALNAYYLRRHLGTVASVAGDGSSITLTTEHGQTLTLKPDQGANPTLFYNLDVRPVVALPTNVVPATLTTGMHVACTARYQADGTLTAVRVWYTSAALGTLPGWTPEGHITRVDRVNSVIQVLDSQGNPKPFVIAPATKWYFHGDTSVDISGGDGVAFLNQVERFFKVQITVVDPTATPMVAATVDIQRGVFEGNITAADTSSFTYNKTFLDLAAASHTLGYGSAFSYWDFTFPGLASTSIPNFVTQASDGIVLDTTGHTVKPYGVSSLSWSTGSGWNANNVVFMPTPVSPFVQTVTTAYAGGSMQVTARGASAIPITVTLDPAAQEQPLVTAFTRQAGAVVTVTNLDSTQWAAALASGAKVRVFGIPDGTGKLKAFYVNVYQ